MSKKYQYKVVAVFLTIILLVPVFVQASLTEVSDESPLKKSVLKEQNLHPFSFSEVHEANNNPESDTHKVIPDSLHQTEPTLMQSPNCDTAPIKWGPLWNTSFGGVGDQFAHSITEGHDGGFVVSGSTNTTGTEYRDIWWGLLDDDGAIAWNNSLEGPMYESSREIIKCNSGGYAISGRGLVRIDNDGNHLWNNTYDAGYFYDILELQNGDFLLLGVNTSNDNDAFLVRVNGTGHHLWNKTYGGPSQDYFWSGFVAPDGNIIVIGATESYGAGGSDIWLVKLAIDGTAIWNKTFGGSHYDYGRDVIRCSNGDLAIAGFALSYGVGQYDMWWIRTTSEGVHIWNNTYGRPYWDQAESIIERPDGGFVIVGWLDTFTNACLVRTDESGNILWTQEYMEEEGYYGGFTDVIETPDGGFVTSGILSNSSGKFGSYEAWVVRFPEDQSPAWLEPPTNQQVEYGNPFHYDLNASDPSGLAHWWLNDSVHFSVDSQGVISNITSLDILRYNLRISVCDVYGNTLCSDFQIHVEDTTPPIWVFEPTDIELVFGAALNYKIEAWDVSGISLWTVNDSSNFAVDETGYITSISPLLESVYGLRVTVYDNFMNSLFTDFRIMIQDPSNPWDDEDSDGIPNYLDWLSNVEVCLTDLPTEDWPQDTIYRAFCVTPSDGYGDLHHTLDDHVQTEFWDIWNPTSGQAKAQGYIKQLYIVEMNRDFFVSRILMAGNPIDPLMSLLAACVPSCSDDIVRVVFAQTDHDPFYLQPLSYEWFFQDGDKSLNKDGIPLHYKLASYSMLSICANPNRFEERLSSLPSIIPFNPIKIFDYVWATIGLFDGTITPEAWLELALSQWVSVTLGMMGVIMTSAEYLSAIVGIAIQYLQNVVIAFLNLFESLDVDLYVSVDGEVVLGSNSTGINSSPVSIYGFGSGDIPWCEIIILDADLLIGHDVSLLLDGDDIPNTTEILDLFLVGINNASSVYECNFTHIELFANQHMEIQLDVEIDTMNNIMVDANLSPILYSASIPSEVLRTDNLDVVLNCSDSDGLDAVQVCIQDAEGMWVNGTASLDNGLYTITVSASMLSGNDCIIYSEIIDTRGAKTFLQIGSVSIIDAPDSTTNTITTITSPQELPVLYLIIGLVGIVGTVLVVVIWKRKSS